MTMGRIYVGISDERERIAKSWCDMSDLVWKQKIICSLFSEGCVWVNG